MIRWGICCILHQTCYSKWNVQTSANLNVKQAANKALIVFYVQIGHLQIIFGKVQVCTSQKGCMIWVGISHAKAFKDILDITWLVNGQAIVLLISGDANPQIWLDLAIRGAYAAASEMATAVSWACPQAQPPHDHNPSSLCHENWPQRRPPTLHTAHMPCPNKPAGQMVGEKWPLRDWVRTGYLISCMPCHACGCTNITKVNRTSTKRAEMLSGKGLLAVPPFPPL